MTTPDLTWLLAFAERAARDAARLILSADPSNRVVSKKGRIDLVTDVDIAVNRLLCADLSTADFAIDVVAEEGVPKELKKPNADLAWVIDPIDGTTNFVHNIKHSAISIALYDRRAQKSLLGVVLNPFRDECFTARLGGGAFLNHHPIMVSSVASLNEAVICTGFAYDRKTNPDNNLAEFSAIMPEVQGIRRFGAASLDLAYVAAGRFDGYFEQGLLFWDYAAGMLLVHEAGGVTSAYDHATVTEATGHIVAANPKLHPILSDAIKEARSKAGLRRVPTGR